MSFMLIGCGINFRETSRQRCEKPNAHQRFMASLMSCVMGEGRFREP